MATKLTALLLAIAGILAIGCGLKRTATPATQPASKSGTPAATEAKPPAEPVEPAKPARVDPMKRLELELAEAKSENRRLRRRLEDQEAARASLFAPRRA